MKRVTLIHTIAICLLFLSFYSKSFADDAIVTTGVTDSGTASNTSDDDLPQDFVNFAAYIGYNVTKAPQDSPINSFLNLGDEQSIINSVMGALFQAIPVNAINSALSAFVPNDSSFSSLNKYANVTFQNFNSPNPAKGISVNPLIDQQAFQQDPVSQIVLNMLSTPVSDAMGKCTCIGACTPLCYNTVMSNVIGILPTPDQFYSTTYNSSVIGQLNSNTLIAPLLYSDTSFQDNNAQPGTTGQLGLTASNQIGEAANFIRYVTGSVLPVPLPTYSIYNAAYTATLAKDNDGNPTANAIWQYGTMAHYLASLRVFAAQQSVAIGNLYSILSKRLPQTPPDSQSPTSQALSEYVMATWRLQPANAAKTGQNSTWLQQINTASNTTIQKEMILLLAEINYQLYLNRQMEERILLTNSVALIQNAKMPEVDLSTDTNPANYRAQ